MDAFNLSQNSTFGVYGIDAFDESQSVCVYLFIERNIWKAEFQTRFTDTSALSISKHKIVCTGL